MLLSLGLPAPVFGQRGLVRVDEYRTAGAVDYGNVTVISRVEGVADTGMVELSIAANMAANCSAAPFTANSAFALSCAIKPSTHSA